LSKKISWPVIFKWIKTEYRPSKSMMIIFARLFKLKIFFPVNVWMNLMEVAFPVDLKFGKVLGPIETIFGRLTEICLMVLFFSFGSSSLMIVSTSGNSGINWQKTGRVCFKQARPYGLDADGF
jgi:hypothetical protein